MKPLKIIIIVVLIFLAFGCVTQKRCNLKFPPQTSIEIVYRDSIHEEIRYRDTIIYVPIPGELRTDSIFIPVASPGQNYIPDTARAENKYAIAKAWMDWPKIKLNLIQKPQTLEFQLKNAIKEANTYRQLYEKEKSKEVVQVKYTPKFWKFTGWIGIGFIIVFLVWVGLRVKKLLKI